ncbi:unnamed protein product [Hydatigera taeniaeformis]|uniref:Uncharacterized protein n=1 Tax=Hydatigena taeniaeformis TaxID=6205 RepID=A0A0R3XBW5_HYDTA|nr:unnamed protein product [Hydatigera taeniaeformis]
MEDGKNYDILRPPHMIYRKLASQMSVISSGGGLPSFLAEYFAQLVENQLIIACSEVLLEVCSGRSTIESLAFHVNQFLEAFATTCFHIKRIIRNRLGEDEVTQILTRIVKGDGDEVYRLEGLLEPNLARFLISVLRTLYGRVVRAILVYALVSSSSEELDSLLQEILSLNEPLISKPLIEAWITLTDLIFLLAEDLRIDENIDNIQSILRQTKFFIEAGCKGVITIPSAPSHSDQQKRLVKGGLKPIRTRTSSVSASSKSSIKSALTGGQTKSPAQKLNPRQKPSIRDFRFMLNRMSRVPAIRSNSDESLQKDFLNRESEFFSAQRGATNMDIKAESESENDSDDSFAFSSITGIFSRGKYKLAEIESPAELLTKQIKIANREVPTQNFIEPEQMELVEDSWRILAELQGIQKLIGSKDWDDKVATALSKDLYCSDDKVATALSKDLYCSVRCHQRNVGQ